MNEHESHDLISSNASKEMSPLDLEYISINTRGEPLTWGATPLVLTQEVTDQQRDVKREIDTLFDDVNVPEFVSLRLADYIYSLNMSRTFNRESKNQESFIYREKMNLDGLPLEVIEVAERAMAGHASPAELLCIQKVLGIPSIELASLTHPYGQRIELLKEMRPAVNEAIELTGGTLVKDIPPTFKVKACDNPHDSAQMEGIHITRTTIFGYLEDGTEICERSSAVILIDQLPLDVAQAIRAVPYTDHKLWTQQVARACQLLELAPELLDDNEYTTAIPVSTTIISVNAKLEALLLDDETKHKRQLGHYMAMQVSKI